MKIDALTESAYRISRGEKQITLAQMNLDLARFGMKLDPAMNAQGFNRYLTGDRAGVEYPATNMQPAWIDSDSSPYRYQCPRQNTPEYAAFKEYRGTTFAIVRGRIYSI